ncbi:cytochrome c family protein [Hyphomicrobium sp. CS1GBMeth3]|uniref:c-type cytochrome n=1 Tax=Hyphomicrobium sp. CS1GBMeth3 TaxID=1892845 RepID=UPI000AAA83D2|nr:cytochrome c family protein [Hyphomicrobium sp. CS1GBMeth3]
MVDSFELSKFAGAVLAALLVIFVPKTFIDIAHQSHSEITGGYTLPAPAEGGGGATDGGGAAAPAVFDPAQVIAALPTANPDNGAGTFKKCLACHSAQKDAASKAGPNLWGVLGRPHASYPDFKGYSDAMKSKNVDWNYADLAHFLHKPREFMPGTKMIFAGVSDTGELADLIAYIRTLSDSPLPLPEATAPAAQPDAGAAPAPAPETPAPAPQ